MIYLQQLFHGNLGVSFSNQQPVAEQPAGSAREHDPMVALGTVVAIVGGW